MSVMELDFRLTPEAHRELMQAKKEPALTKLDIMLEICFKCMLCDVSNFGRFTDIKEHLMLKHGTGACNKSEKNLENFTSHRQNVFNDDTLSFPRTESEDYEDRESSRDSKQAVPCGYSQIEACGTPSLFSPNDVCHTMNNSYLEKGCFSDESSSEGESPIAKAKIQLLEWERKYSTELNEEQIETEDNKNLPELLISGETLTTERRKKESNVKQDRNNSKTSYLTRAKSCPVCEQVLDDVRGCWQHYTSSHLLPEKMSSMLPNIQQLSLSVSKSVICPLCNKELKGNALLKHIILVHLWRPKLKNIRRKRQMLCPICGKAFNFEQNYYIHLRTVHNGIKSKSHSKYVPKKFECKECDYKTCEKRRLNSHKKYVHAGIKAYSCKHCSYATWERTSLRDHMFRHNDNKPYRCERCSYQCIQKKQLRAHLQRRHNVMLEKTGHTRVASSSRRGPRQLTIVEMTDREASTDPVRKSKTKMPKSLANTKNDTPFESTITASSVHTVSSAKESTAFTPGKHTISVLDGSTPGERSHVPTMHLVHAVGGMTYAMLDEVSKSQSMSPHVHGSPSTDKPMLRYSVQGPIISQVTSPKVSSQISTSSNSMICTFALPPASDIDQHYILPPAGSMQNLLMSSGGQALIPRKSETGCRHVSNFMLESSQPMFVSPNLQEKTAYQILQIPNDQNLQQPSLAATGPVVNTAGNLAQAITVTPIYAQNPPSGHNLSLSELSNANPQCVTSQPSFVYVLK